MSRWGLLLLLVYIVLGLRRGGLHEAARAAVWVTAGVLLVVALKEGAL